MAEVISVGPGGTVDGKTVVMSVKAGDKVITDKDVSKRQHWRHSPGRCG